MYLQRLELQGFKTFAKRTVLEFPELKKGHQGITSIVGPNGSGKSNIADAIRWVLGEQSLKMLRCKRSEDIIFSGTEGKARQNLAEVSLYLNNEDKKVPLEFSEVVITRRLYRDGTSEYLINKSAVRLIDVLLLLAKAQFGQKSYSVIGQGMIDAVLTATPADRKSFFYEATGVKEYQMKKEHAENKLSRTAENLQHVELTLNEMEPHLRSLQRMVKRLSEREEVETQLREIQKQYYGAKNSHLQRELSEYRARLEKHTQEHASLFSETTSLQAELETAETGDRQDSVFDALQIEYQKISNDRDLLLRTIANLKGKQDSEYQKTGQHNIVWLETRLDELASGVAELSAFKKQNEARLSEHMARLNQLQSEKGEHDAAMAQIKADIELLQKKMRSSSIFSAEDLVSEIESLHLAQKNFLLSFESARDFSSFESLKKETRSLLEMIAGIREHIRFLGGNQPRGGVAITEESAEELMVLDQKLAKHAEQRNALLSKIAELSGEQRALEASMVRSDAELSKLKQERELREIELRGAKAKDPAEHERFLSELRNQQDIAAEKLQALEILFAEKKSQLSLFHKTEEEKKQRMIGLQRRLQAKQQEASLVQERINEVQIAVARAEVHRDELDRECFEALAAGLETLDVSEAISSVSAEALQPEIRRLKQKLDLIGGIDPEAVKEYEEVKQRNDFLRSQFDDLKGAKESLHEIIFELDKKIEKQFQEQFTVISEMFGKFFIKLFGGGSASLEKVMEEFDSVSDPNETQASDIPQEDDASKEKKKKVFSGVDIFASPPGKKVKNINALSGGEKAMTSLALVSAIISTNPSPFVVLDEVDAALDEANSEKYSEIVEHLSDKTQFIIITHNRATMKRSHILYGVTAGKDSVSQLISLKLEDAERMVKR